MNWLRWIFVCRLGRDCADVRVASDAPFPPGLVLELEYECGGCGRVYHRFFEHTEEHVEAAVRPLGNVDVIRNGGRHEVR